MKKEGSDAETMKSMKQGREGMCYHQKMDENGNNQQSRRTHEKKQLVSSCEPSCSSVASGAWNKTAWKTFGCVPFGCLTKV